MYLLHIAIMIIMVMSVSFRPLETLFLCSKIGVHMGLHYFLIFELKLIRSYWLEPP